MLIARLQLKKQEREGKGEGCQKMMTERESKGVRGENTPR